MQARSTIPLPAYVLKSQLQAICSFTRAYSAKRGSVLKYVFFVPLNEETTTLLLSEIKM